MNLNIDSNQFLVDKNGIKKSVLLPYKEYDKMMKTINLYTEMREFESSMIKSFREIKANKRGKTKAKSLLSFLDEV